MAVDHKYGRVTTEKGTIGEDEPVVIFRAQDETLGNLLGFYHLFCAVAGSPRHHLDAIMDTREEVLAWQEENHTHTPRSDSLAP